MIVNNGILAVAGFEPATLVKTKRVIFFKCNFFSKTPFLFEVKTMCRPRYMHVVRCTNGHNSPQDLYSMTLNLAGLT